MADNMSVPSSEIQQSYTLKFYALFKAFARIDDSRNAGHFMSRMNCFRWLRQSRILGPHFSRSRVADLYQGVTWPETVVSMDSFMTFLRHLANSSEKLTYDFLIIRLVTCGKPDPEKYRPERYLSKTTSKISTVKSEWLLGDRLKKVRSRCRMSEEIHKEYERQFKEYSKPADPTRTGGIISVKSAMEWLWRAEILDETVTASEQKEIYTDAVKTWRVMNPSEMLQFSRHVAKKLCLSTGNIKKRLIGWEEKDIRSTKISNIFDANKFPLNALKTIPPRRGRKPGMGLNSSSPPKVLRVAKSSEQRNHISSDDQSFLRVAESVEQRDRISSDDQSLLRVAESAEQRDRISSDDQSSLRVARSVEQRDRISSDDQSPLRVARSVEQRDRISSDDQSSLRVAKSVEQRDRISSDDQSSLRVARSVEQRDRISSDDQSSLRVARSVEQRDRISSDDQSSLRVARSVEQRDRISSDDQSFLRVAESVEQRDRISSGDQSLLCVPGSETKLPAGSTSGLAEFNLDQLGVFDPNLHMILTRMDMFLGPKRSGFGNLFKQYAKLEDQRNTGLLLSKWGALLWFREAGLLGENIEYIRFLNSFYHVAKTETAVNQEEFERVIAHMADHSVKRYKFIIDALEDCDSPDLTDITKEIPEIMIKARSLWDHHVQFDLGVRRLTAELRKK